MGREFTGIWIHLEGKEGVVKVKTQLSNGS